MSIFCTNVTHTMANYKFCLACAQREKPINQIFYCNKCYLQGSKKHSGHTTKQYSLQSQSFSKPYYQFKELFRSKINQIIKKSGQGDQLDAKMVLQNMIRKPNFYHFFTGQSINDLMRNQDFKMWLVTMKFWECSQKTFVQKINQEVKEKLSDNEIIKSIILDKKIMKDQASKFRIVWEAIDDQGQNQSNQIQKVNSELLFLQRQKQILHFFLKMYSSYSIQQCYQCKDLCEELIRKYSDCKILYLAKIRILQLLPRGCQQIQKVLKDIAQIDQKFMGSDIYYYYLAGTQWQRIQNQNESNQMGIDNLFYQVKNKSYYRLRNVERYIQNILKAISIKPKNEYYLACAIGYIVQKKYDMSQRYFQKALQQKFESESMDNNLIFTQIKNNKFDPQTAIKSLQVRTMQFIKNIAKYFKKHQHYQNLLKCCQIMIAREPVNDKIKIQFVKAILLHGNQKGNANRFKQHLNLAASMITQLRQSKKSEKQGKLLGKKLALVKARAAWDKNKYQQSVQKFRQVPNKNATDQYNLAASLFQLNKDQHDQDIYKEALQAINKAIILAQCEKPKYLSLKFYICCYLSDFETAKQLSKYIDQDKNRELLQYIQNYLS